MQNNLDDKVSQKGYFPNLVEMSRPLEVATSLALMELKLLYDDLTHVYNGKFMKEHHGHQCGYTPDYTIVDSVAVECKAWNTTYRVSKKMISDKVFRRLEGNWQYKIAVFSEKPNYQNGVESYVLSTRIQPVYVGFRVTWHSLKRAVQIIKSKLRNILGIRMSHSMSAVSRLMNARRKKQNQFERGDDEKKPSRGLDKIPLLFKSMTRNVLSPSLTLFLKKLLVSRFHSLHFRVWLSEFLELRLNPKAESLTEGAFFHLLRKGLFFLPSYPFLAPVRAIPSEIDCMDTSRKD